ncbi:MAG: YfiR family protein [Phycisphaerae bacterium]|nr:YfiR family protein [Phycisphaerae bacterium]
MRTRICILLVAFLALHPALVHGQAAEESASQREYQVKAAFVYNFLKFVVGGRFGAADEKAGSDSDPNGTIVVGVCGRVPSKESFAELQGKRIKNKQVKVRFFQGFEDLKDSEQKIPDPHPQMAEIRQCHVLFLCPSEKPFWSRVLPPLQKEGILLVGDSPGFLEAGGIINLVIEEKKVRFEVNLAAAARGKLQIRSSLLRLALRTMEHDSLERQGNEDR